jgi:hypothetical protein
MRLNIGGGGLRSLLLCLVLFLTAFSSATAHEAWSVDVAQMLMADQWDMEAGEQPAVVGYVIHLVEVERSLAHSLGFQMELETKESPGLWLVAGRDLDLSFQLEGPLTWSAQSQIHLDGDHQAKSYDSWLVTMDGEPLHVDVSKMKVPPDPHQSKEERLEITIFAKTIQDERIESEIHISYETLQGSAAEVSTTHWVSAATDQPLAVVARQVNTGRRTEYQYFAVYVAGSLIPAELIPDDAPVWPMGSVKGIEQFMAGVPQQRWAEVGVSLARGQENWGWQLDGSFPLGDKHRVYGQVGAVPDTAYLLGAEGSVNSELHFVAEAVAGQGQQPFLRFGVRDDVYLSENLLLSASLLPFTFSFESWKPAMVFNWRVKAELLQEDYGLWYQLDNDKSVLRHTIGASVFPNRSVGAKVSWSWDGQSGSVFMAGIQIRF